MPLKVSGFLTQRYSLVHGVRVLTLVWVCQNLNTKRNHQYIQQVPRLPMQFQLLPPHILLVTYLWPKEIGDYTYKWCRNEDAIQGPQQRVRVQEHPNLFKHGCLSLALCIKGRPSWSSLFRGTRLVTLRA